MVRKEKRKASAEEKREEEKEDVSRDVYERERSEYVCAFVFVCKCVPKFPFPAVREKN